MHHRLSNLGGFKTGRIVIAPILADYAPAFAYGEAKRIFEEMELGLCILVAAGKAGACNPKAGCLLLIIDSSFDQTRFWFHFEVLFFQVDSVMSGRC